MRFVKLCRTAQFQTYQTRLIGYRTNSTNQISSPTSPTMIQMPNSPWSWLWLPIPCSKTWSSTASAQQHCCQQQCLLGPSEFLSLSLNLSPPPSPSLSIPSSSSLFLSPLLKQRLSLFHFETKDALFLENFELKFRKWFADFSSMFTKKKDISYFKMKQRKPSINFWALSLSQLLSLSPHSSPSLSLPLSFILSPSPSLPFAALLVSICPGMTLHEPIPCWINHQPIPPPI